MTQSHWRSTDPENKDMELSDHFADLNLWLAWVGAIHSTDKSFQFKRFVENMVILVVSILSSWMRETLDHYSVAFWLAAACAILYIAFVLILNFGMGRVKRDVPLHIKTAIKTNDTVMLSELMKAGISPDDTVDVSLSRTPLSSARKRRVPALLYAVFLDQTDMVNALLNAFVDTSMAMRDESAGDVMRDAFRQQNTTKIVILLEWGFNPERLGADEVEVCMEAINDDDYGWLGKVIADQALANALAKHTVVVVTGQTGGNKINRRLQYKGLSATGKPRWDDGSYLREIRWESNRGCWEIRVDGVDNDGKRNMSQYYCGPTFEQDASLPPKTGFKGYRDDINGTEVNLSIRFSFIKPKQL